MSMDSVDLWELTEHKICQKTVHKTVENKKTARSPNFARN